MNKKSPTETTPRKGTPAEHVSWALRHAAKGEHGMAAAHYGLAWVLLANQGRASAANRAWRKYQRHKRLAQRGNGPTH